jgi:hypothetical protein
MAKQIYGFEFHEFGLEPALFFILGTKNHDLMDWSELSVKSGWVWYVDIGNMKRTLACVENLVIHRYA